MQPPRDPAQFGQVGARRLRQHPEDRPVAIAWGAHTARCEELARAVGGSALRLQHERLRGRRTAPLRWLIDAVRTTSELIRHPPSGLIIQNPPILLGLLGLVLVGRRGRPVVLDSHPAAFGEKGGPWGALTGLHRFVARRSRLVVVTDEVLAERVRRWGARTSLLHEAPPAPTDVVRRPCPVHGTAPRRPTALFVGVFASDEPIDEVLGAARQLPDCDVVVTGDLRRAPAGVVATAPPNVEFVGYLGPEEYAAAVDAADVVLALTTASTSVMRAAYEAVYAHRPLVLSDWPVLRTLFPFAVHVDNDATAIASGLRGALADLPRLRAAAPDALALQEARWAEQVATLRAALEVSSA